MKIYTNDLVKGHSDFKVKCLTFGLYTQVSDSGLLALLLFYTMRILSSLFSDHLLLGRDMWITEIGITMEIIRDPLTGIIVNLNTSLLQ